MRKLTLLLAMAFALMTPLFLRADAASDAEALAAESTEKCKSTESTKPTPKMIMDKVNAAASIVEKEGKDAFSKFKGKNSEFIFAGTYIWIHNLDGKMLMHPIKPKMEGNELLGLRDSKGKQFFVEMNRIVSENGAGWCDYYWPKPGETDASLKVSYVKIVKKGDESFILGCGVYDMPIDDVQKSSK